MFPLSISHLMVLAIAVLALALQVKADTIEYCSSINTASTNANSSIWQSNGLCQNFCQDTYAFAVLQDSNCWCSDYVPGVSVSTGNCNSPCPGYPNDLCGGSGLYGYIELQISPKGTKGASSSSQPTTSQKAVSSTPQPTTADQPSTSSKPTSTTSSTPSTTSAAVTSTSSAQDATSSTWTPTPVTSLETVTGQVRTVTVTPTSPPQSAASLPGISSAKKSGGGGISTGGAVGLTIGLVALVAIVGALLFFWFRRRRRSDADGVTSSHISPKGSMTEVPQRTNSESSRYMLNSDGRRVTEAWEAEGDDLGPRRSRLMPVDPRLDPFAPVYQRDGRASHESTNTLQDNHDYSRKVLRAVNPDV